MRGTRFVSDICTSKPAGRRYVQKNFAQFFDWCAEVEPKYVWIWPYDSGSWVVASVARGAATAFYRLARRCRKWLEHDCLTCRSSCRPGFSTTKTGRDSIACLAGKKAGQSMCWPNKPPTPYPPVCPGSVFQRSACTPLFLGVALGQRHFRSVLRSSGMRSRVKSVAAFLLGGDLRRHYQGRLQPILLERSTGDRHAAQCVAYEYSPEVVDDILQVIATLEQNHHFRWWPGKLQNVSSRRT